MTSSPLTLIIAIALAALFVRSAFTALDPGRRQGMILVAFGLSLVITTASWLSIRGFFLDLNDVFLPVVLVSILAVTAPLSAVRMFPWLAHLWQRLLDKTPPSSPIAIQAIRIAAVGTMVKWYQGDLPTYFMLSASIPDFLFGLSAPWVARRTGSLTRSFIVIWNSIGIAIFLGALLSIQLSVPGPLRVLHSIPSAEPVLQYPLALVPTTIAPMLILLHVFSIAQSRRSVRR